MGFRSASLMFRRAMAGVALAGVLGLSACGGDDGPSGPSGDVYTLRSIGDTDFPINYSGEEGTMNAKGYVALQTNGTYNFRVTQTIKPTGAPRQTFVYGEDGTYTISGTTITFTATHDIDEGERTPAEDTTPYTGTKTATTITAETDEGTIVFSK